MDNTVKELVGLIVLVLVYMVCLLFVVGFMSNVIIRKIEENKRRQEKNSVVITAINGHLMELINKIKIRDTRLLTIQQTLNSKEADKRLTNQEVEKNEL